MNRYRVTINVSDAQAAGGRAWDLWCLHTAPTVTRGKIRNGRERWTVRARAATEATIPVHDAIASCNLHDMVHVEHVRTLSDSAKRLGSGAARTEEERRAEGITQLKIRVTDAERALVEQLAERRGLPLGPAIVGAVREALERT